MHFKILKHSDLSARELDKIIELKNIHWSHPLEQHTEWIEENIKSNDSHFMMFENQILLGYANLVNVNVEINSYVQDFIGIGNVCSRNAGLGHGTILIKEISDFLLEKKYKGILFCKDDLIDFYARYEWILVQKDLVRSSVENKINILIFNYDSEISNFAYYDRNF